MKKWIKILIILVWVLILLGWFIYWDQTRCYEIQTRCKPIDLSAVYDSEDLEFYHSLNDKCMGKCWTAKIKLNIKKWWCRQQYKDYKERTKDRRYFRPDTYNPCPELYTLPELNSFLKN